MRLLKKAALRLARDERGNVALITAVGMVAFLGFLALVADFGSVYLHKQKLNNALDAGALSGIQRVLFGEADARATAEAYVRQNGETPTNVDVDVDEMIVDVDGQRQVDLTFAKVLGYDRATVTSDVEARAGVTVAGQGFVPIAVPEQDFVYGQLYTLSQGAGDGSSGNYGFLDFTGSGGASELEALIRYGYDGKLRVGQEVETETGVNTGPVRDAIRSRIYGDSSAYACTDYRTAASGCQRILYLPVIDSLADLTGNDFVTIVGFAAFYLEGIEGGGGHQEIVGRFIRTIMPGEMGEGRDFGLYSVKLTH
ncbi:MAG TPA: TadE/TadG family type IV pilus assembly protein [Bacilli bacterium]|nr:TadE/TadG family type IV pilus assembly protein [Bacilli bacterium]